MKPPPSATPGEQWELKRLRFMPASQFNIHYASLEVKETGLEARRGEAWSVRQEARKDLPMRNVHLKLSKATVEALAPST